MASNRSPASWAASIPAATRDTTDVLIESALWDPINIARTGRTLGIITDARYRFERGVDPEFMVPGLELATRMVLDFCGGEASETESSAMPAITEPKDRRLPLSRGEAPDRHRRAEGRKPRHSHPSRLRPVRRATAISRRGCRSVAAGRRRQGRSRRGGHAHPRRRQVIAPQPLESHDAVNGRILTTLQIRTRAAKRALAVRGMMEAVTWSFIPAKHAEAFGGGQPALKLANPIAADMSDMRPSLLPGLVSAAQRNADRGHGDVALFEVSGTYEGDTPDRQRRVAGGVRRGTNGLDGAGRSWSGNAKAVGVYDAKADALLHSRPAARQWTSCNSRLARPDWYHPGRSGVIKLGPKTGARTFWRVPPEGAGTARRHRAALPASKCL
jgi:phenylalanyl-tRNA synthetase beta chain